MPVVQAGKAVLSCSRKEQTSYTCSDVGKSERLCAERFQIKETPYYVIPFI